MYWKYLKSIGELETNPLHFFATAFALATMFLTTLAAWVKMFVGSGPSWDLLVVPTVLPLPVYLLHFGMFLLWRMDQ